MATIYKTIIPDLYNLATELTYQPWSNAKIVNSPQSLGTDSVPWTQNIRIAKHRDMFMAKHISILGLGSNHTECLTQV